MDIYDGYSVHDLDDLRAAVAAVQRAVNVEANSDRGLLMETAVKIVADNLAPLGPERTINALAAMAYAFAVDKTLRMSELNNAASDRIVNRLKEQGLFPPRGEPGS